MPFHVDEAEAHLSVCMSVSLSGCLTDLPRLLGGQVLAACAKFNYEMLMLLDSSDVISVQPRIKVHVIRSRIVLRILPVSE